MIHHAWTVICQKSIIDSETNNISLDVLEQLNFTIPAIPPTSKGVVFPIQMEIVSLWYRADKKPTKADARILLKPATGDVVVTATLAIDLTQSSRSRTRARLDGLPIPKDSSGYYYAIVELKSEETWIEVGRVPLEINLQQKPS